MGVRGQHRRPQQCASHSETKSVDGVTVAAVDDTAAGSLEETWKALGRAHQQQGVDRSAGHRMLRLIQTSLLLLTGVPFRFRFSQTLGAGLRWC